MDGVGRYAGVVVTDVVHCACVSKTRDLQSGHGRSSIAIEKFWGIQAGDEVLEVLADTLEPKFS